MLSKRTAIANQGIRREAISATMAAAAEKHKKGSPVKCGSQPLQDVRMPRAIHAAEPAKFRNVMKRACIEYKPFIWGSYGTTLLLACHSILA